MVGACNSLRRRPSGFPSLPCRFKSPSGRWIHSRKPGAATHRKIRKCFKCTGQRAGLQGTLLPRRILPNSRSRCAGESRGTGRRDCLPGPELGRGPPAAQGNSEGRGQLTLGQHTLRFFRCGWGNRVKRLCRPSANLKESLSQKTHRHNLFFFPSLFAMPPIHPPCVGLCLLRVCVGQTPPGPGNSGRSPCPCRATGNYRHLDGGFNTEVPGGTEASRRGGSFGVDVEKAMSGLGSEGR